MLEHLATVLASWYDPGENGFDVGDLLSICLVVGALYGFVVAVAKFVRWADARKDQRHRLDVEAIMKPHLDALDERLVQQTKTLTEAIDAATKPIQPGTNGGLSMTDLHGKVSDALDTLTRMETRLAVLEGPSEPRPDDGH